MKLSAKFQSSTLELIAAAFILLFVYTGISKLIDIQNFEMVLATSPILKKFYLPIAWGIPISELIIAILLFFQKTRKLGLLFSLVFMVGFTSYIFYMIYFTPDLPCSCGGVLSQMTWKQHLIFNLFFTILALIGLLINYKKIPPISNEKNANPLLG